MSKLSILEASGPMNPESPARISRGPFARVEIAAGYRQVGPQEWERLSSEMIGINHDGGEEHVCELRKGGEGEPKMVYIFDVGGSPHEYARANYRTWNPPLGDRQS